MVYPPQWRQVTADQFAVRLLRERPFAHLLSRHGALAATRIPFVADTDAARPVRLRAHLNANNPQAAGLDGAEVLVVFSGPSTYVSPHWRASKTRAGTFDYEEVQVRGRARIEAGIEFFRRLIDDLSSLIEPQYAEVGDYPIWNTTMAPEGYIERLFPQVVSFSIEIESVHAVSKLHQQFPEADRRAIADHLNRCKREDARAIAARILATLAAASCAP